MPGRRLILSVMLAGCATPLLLPAMKVTGAYASSLSSRDIQQIQQLATARADIGAAIRTVEAVRPNRVRVEAGRPIHSGWSGISFFAVRQHGRWHIDEQRPLEGVAERTFITY